MFRPLIVGALCALAGLMLTPASHAATRACGLTARIDGVRYDVRETRGNVACRTVKRVVTTFLRDDEVASPWTCFRGHGASPYAASCARGKSVVVRVYAPT
ncbi:hypothetical protein OM076_23725 [Solirubrobacter ginsenosidimutans]|uniref:Uncharacterized protein n=1 Tax=Solirubrobacter ginsenosidimutans TaxID=490573 RepID=A0A9X3S1E4_9ACTN|nr:hypothetical protein [Solirubrobacter ginsenosidimutans]MDA0163305.1 hypothetical protein [Solirubrobacter ginsenosidimutans]